MRIVAAGPAGMERDSPSVEGMRIARSLEQAGFDKNSVVTIGTFDGMHLGHRAVIARVLEKRAALNGRSVVVTFDPHPRSVVDGAPVGLLTTMDERIDLFRGAGIDLVLIVDFSYEFSRQSASSFYERYIIRGTGVSEVVVGHDHVFGRDREASIETLRVMGKESGFAMTTVGPVTSSGVRISSSSIRRHLSEGRVADARISLGRPYELRATVVRGDGRGARIGFPTANLLPVSPEKVVPRGGVYLAVLDVDGVQRHGMVNIGTRPTFTGDGRVVIEAHLFDWSGDLYGKMVTPGFLGYIREEKKFLNVHELTAQLVRDRDECLRRIDAVQ
ncbi:MAG TPA: riboflavin biosynthesis protein RibF [Bacteroidota bacterium]|nr:riboflavin biosynthesis protein RibF [Bacteroidota bacterium]